ncbi:isoleucine--tRNA ligase [Candidatus Saccharibacteria bacterium]|nr:isoleucine--tRNA ligase [Candidatus Saccharibacteria bacterium]
MKYQPRKRAIEYEKALVLWWKKNRIFEKSVEQRAAHNSYVFYDGPPFITGLPHHGTLLSSIVKDAVPRFWTMRGKRVERKWGWDCHGLPAENFVEKQLGITDRRDIGTKWSLEDYIIKARESMVASSALWEGTIDRVGRWVDFRNGYRTMDKNFMESVWWAFKKLYDAGKIYEGRKVLMYDTKFATPVSKAEVTMDNDAYREVTDPSAYVKFKVLSQEQLKNILADTNANGDGATVYLLAWTTTPWTLPANLALAVNPEMDYALYEVGGELLIMATALADKVLVDDKLGKEGKSGTLEQRVLKTFSGKELVGLEYEPLIETVPYDSRKKDTYHVLAGDFVSSEDGTGIVHIAPAYGEDDYQLMIDSDVDFVDVLDDNGYYLPEMAEKLHELGVRDTDENGIEIWAGNKFIAKCLEEKGIVYKIEYIKHEYPFNPRSKQRIMYRAFPSWFFDVQNAKPLMLEQNENINWFPEYLKHGRFAKNIEQAPDWNLSRDRFWATAMPVWKSDAGTVKVVGSYDELYELSGVRLEDYHRPWVDEVEFDAYVKDGEIVDKSAKGAKKEHFKRIEKVLDCWFESGSMPFAQLHYPFENKEKFENNYPADFIVEYVGQVRAWFYYVHVVNTALFSKNAYLNVITTGTLAGNDGRKMSKSLGNFTDPNELMDKYSADSLRLLLLSSPVLAGEDFALIDKDVSDVARKLTMIWNVYDFFITYANVDDFDYHTSGFSDILLQDAETKKLGAGSAAFSEKELTASLANDLDKWIVSRVYQLRDEITEGMEEYNLPKATAGILPFVDDLSNFFVRRSRRRFWKSEDDNDKIEAYATLHYVLLYLSKIIAPFVPFLAEELYHNLTGKNGSSDSVHLLDWPEKSEIDMDVVQKMARTREIISEGLAMRMNKSETEEQIKIRQPLSSLMYDGEKLLAEYEQMIADEVNVKKVIHGKEMKLNKKLTELLKKEGQARELIRVVQAARKKAGLNVDDRIKLYVSCKMEPEFSKMLMQEVLAEEFSMDGDVKNYVYDEIAKVNNEQITLSLEKA